MAKLTFTGRSGDGKRLLLVDESGQEHTLAIDARLRRALSDAPARGPHTPGQLEIPMESSLRPRDRPVPALRPAGSSSWVLTATALVAHAGGPRGARGESVGPQREVNQEEGEITPRRIRG